MITGCVTAPGRPSADSGSGCGDLVVVEGVGDDRGGHVDHVLTERGGASGDQPVDILADKGTSVQVQCYQGNYYRINAGPDVRFGRTVTHRAGWAVWTQVQPVSKVRLCTLSPQPSVPLLG